MRSKRGWVMCLMIAAIGAIAVRSMPAAAPAKKTARKKPAPQKRYRSSVGPKAVTNNSKSPVPTRKKALARRVLPKRPSVSARVRAEAHDGVYLKIANGANIPVENPAALIPFFEQLYRHQRGEMDGPLRALQFGDSHTAADEWTGDLRQRFQEKFGDGGSGYSLAGYPYRGYRREDVSSGSTRGWHTDGLVGRSGDGVYGLGGVSLSVNSPHESVYVLADGQTFELFYLQQPGGGSLQIYDNGVPVDQISTDGDSGPGYYRYEAEAGTHRLEAETLDRAPVRLFGWVAEKATGVTYETLGINGAQASMILNWDDKILESNIERRDPALIVLAYGTNEAGHKEWTVDTYRDLYVKLIGRIRSAAPAATILIIGPPDRTIRTRKGWVTLENLDTIIEAERQAAASEGCAFWDLRDKMGGKGSMKQWVQAGMAQNDHTHFTAPGYRTIGDAVFRDLMSQYEIFLKARDALAKADPMEDARPTGAAH